MMVIIPCKRLDQGKSRLAECLTPAARLALCRQFLAETLRLATTLAPAARVVLVSADPEAIAIGAGHGVRHLPDRGVDMNTALREAQRELRQRDGGLPALIVPIDLPLATADAVAAISRVRADVGIVPDRRDEGTNLLYLSEVAFERLPLAFGTDSFRKHCDAADARGLSLAVVRDWRLTFDVDRPDDYASWRKGGAEGP